MKMPNVLKKLSTAFLNARYKSAAKQPSKPRESLSGGYLDTLYENSYHTRLQKGYADMYQQTFGPKT